MARTRSAASSSSKSNTNSNPNFFKANKRDLPSEQDTRNRTKTTENCRTKRRKTSFKHNSVPGKESNSKESDDDIQERLEKKREEDEVSGSIDVCKVLKENGTEARSKKDGTAGGESKVKAEKVGNGNSGEKISKTGNGKGKEKVYKPGYGQMEYILTAAPPSWDDKKMEYVFEGFPEFRPNLSPRSIIQSGAFGGCYFKPVKTKRTKIELVDDWNDLPVEWYEDLCVDQYLTNPEYDPETNKWKAKVGQSFEQWEAAGWILPQFDARGWFQWYYRFWMGRRCEDDERQIGRWYRLASGSSGRWRRILYGKYVSKGVNEVEPNEENVSKGIRQTLLHWAYEPTTEHLNEFREEKGHDVANIDDDMPE